MFAFHAECWAPNFALLKEMLSLQHFKCPSAAENSPVRNNQLQEGVIFFKRGKYLIDVANAATFCNADATALPYAGTCCTGRHFVVKLIAR